MEDSERARLRWHSSARVRQASLKLWAATGHEFVGRVVVALTLVILGWIEFGPAVRVVLSPGGDVLGEVYENFNDGAITPPQQVEVAGFQPCADGWCLMPGLSGTLVYRIRATHEVPSLNLWFYRPEGGNQLSVSVDQGKSYKVVLHNARLIGTRVNLGVRATPGQELWLKFEAFNASPNQALVLDECRIFYRADAVPRLPVRRDLVIAFVVFGLAAVVLCRRWPLALSTLAILAVAAALRYDALTLLIDTPLDSDAWMYRWYTTVMSPFTDKGFFSAQFGVREPMFILVGWLYAKLFGASDLGFRVMSVLLSLAGVWATLRVGRMLFGAILGQAIGLLMAINGPLVNESVRFLRLELEIVLCMVYFAVALTLLKRSPKKVIPAAAVLSVAGVLLVSTRMTYLAVVVALNAWFLACLAPIAVLPLRQRLRPWIAGMAVTVAILAVFVVAHRYNMYKLHDDAFYDMSQYSRWLANFEFAGRPGFPTRKELEKAAAIGPKITYGEYMGMHSRSEILEGTLRGYWKIFRRLEVAPWVEGLDKELRARIDEGFQLVAGLGLLLALCVRRYRWIPLAVLVFEFPVAFLYDRSLVELYRHSYSSLPLVLFAAALPLAMLWKSAVERWAGPLAWAVRPPQPVRRREGAGLDTSDLV